MTVDREAVLNWARRIRNAVDRSDCTGFGWDQRKALEAAAVYFEQLAEIPSALLPAAPKAGEGQSSERLSAADAPSDGMIGALRYTEVLDDDKNPTGYHRDVLTGEIVTLGDEYDDDLPTPDPRIQEAIEALKPFAKRSDGYWSHDGQHDYTDDFVILDGLGTAMPAITVGDLRRAKAVHDKLEQNI